jgi:dTDP-glucose pyrophosphorylase/CBS domain-containing protein
MKLSPVDAIASLQSEDRSRINVDRISISRSSTVQEAIACIDRSASVSVALVVDDEKRFVDTLTDGDIRRGIMHGYKLESPVKKLLEIKARTPHPLPTTAPYGTDVLTLIDLMQSAGIRQVPLIDDERRIVDVVTLNELMPNKTYGLQAVVMAGGFGTRLRPLTDRLPKPMLPVAGRPLIERIVEQLRGAGIRNICIATYFRPESIVSHFGDGSDFGVSISYTRESRPLGTGGALGLMERPLDPVIVMNGDIMTGIDFRAMYAFHLEHKAKMTVAVRRYEVKVPYGVVYSSGIHLRRLREKPSLGCFVNAGIYLLDPEVFDGIETGAHLDMTDLIERLLREGESVVTFPVLEYWLDIGQELDYERAQKDASVEDSRIRTSS